VSLDCRSAQVLRCIIIVVIITSTAVYFLIFSSAAYVLQPAATIFRCSSASVQVLIQMSAGAFSTQVFQRGQILNYENVLVFNFVEFS